MKGDDVAQRQGKTEGQHKRRQDAHREKRDDAARRQAEQSPPVSGWNEKVQQVEQHKMRQNEDNDVNKSRNSGRQRA
jgi:hypothetical protein